MNLKHGITAHISNPGDSEVEMGGVPHIETQPRVHSESMSQKTKQTNNKNTEQHKRKGKEIDLCLWFVGILCFIETRGTVCQDIE